MRELESEREKAAASIDDQARLCLAACKIL